MKTQTHTQAQLSQQATGRVPADFLGVLQQAMCPQHPDPAPVPGLGAPAWGHLLINTVIIKVMLELACHSCQESFRH